MADSGSFLHNLIEPNLITLEPMEPLEMIEQMPMEPMEPMNSLLHMDATEPMVPMVPGRFRSLQATSSARRERLSVLVRVLRDAGATE